MDITFGAVPMIILVFKGYLLVKTFMSDYSSFDKNAKGILRDINTNQTTFKHTMKLLLSDVVDESVLNAMLVNPESEHWVRKDLDVRLQYALGDAILDVKEAIYNTYETLDTIREHLIRSQARKPAKPEKRFLVSNLNRGVAIIATAFISNDDAHMQANNIFTYSARRKIVTITKGFLRELKDLCTDLRNRVSDLRALLETLLRNKRAKSAPSNSENEVTTPAAPPDISALSSAIRINSAAHSLHSLTTPTLLCDCHLVYLCLDRQLAVRPQLKDSKGKSEQQEPVQSHECQFTFKLTSSHSRTGAGHGSVLVKFITGDSTVPKPENHPSIEEAKICELSTQAMQVQRVLQDSAVPNSPTFRIRIERLPGISSYLPSRTTESVSLESLISDRHKELKTLDRILIAVNLAHTLLHLYSSPWVRNWGIKSIHFFEKYESTPTTGTWTPYLSVKAQNPDEIQLGDRNRDVFLLGLLLLQLGTKVIIDPTVGKWDMVRTRALADLCREMGPHYSNFVKSCLNSWSDRSMDMMEEKNLKAFLSRITVLEKMGRFFELGED